MPRIDIALQRLRNQRLTGPLFAAPEDVVHALGAVQSQDYPAAKWAVGQRVANCFDADVDAAYTSGAILRTHILRPTWHFVLPRDIRWMQQLTAPRVRKLVAYYDPQLGIDAATIKRGTAAIAKSLQRGRHLTRPEVGKALERAGITASGQRLAHLIMYAELDAVICSGELRGKQHTYALVDERAPNAKTLLRDDALATLATRYFAAHGPALPQDFAWWSGLTVAESKRAIELAGSALQSGDIDGKTYWFDSAMTAAPKSSREVIHLLPNYDECVLSFKDHTPSMHPAIPADKELMMDVLARHIITLNGRVIGGWRRATDKAAPRTGASARIEARLLVRLTSPQLTALHTAAKRYGRFIGMPVAVDVI